jgi:hypothetical protein
MARNASLPFFLGGWQPQAKYEVLLERSDCWIEQYDNLVRMDVLKPWSASHAALVRKYGVEHLQLCSGTIGKRRSLDFLLDLPALRGLTLSVWKPMDLSAVGRLSELRFLWIDVGMTWRKGDQFDPVDLSRLHELERAHVALCRTFESIIVCHRIKDLAIDNSNDGRLGDLDLTHLPALRHLELDHCPGLRSVRLHPRARLRGLKLSLCGSYQIDWQRIGPDLRFLLIGGRLNFPLEQILQAPNLESLHLFQIRKVPPLQFLRKHPHLRAVVIFSAPPGPRISEQDEAVLREINARGTRKLKGRRGK